MNVTVFFLRHGPAIARALAILGAVFGPWAHGAWARRRARRTLAAQRVRLGDATTDLDGTEPGTRVVVEGEWMPSGERGVEGVVRTARGDVRVVGAPRVEAGHVERRAGLRARLVDARLIEGRRVAVAGALRRGSVHPEGYREAEFEHEIESAQTAALVAVADNVVRVRRDAWGIALASVLGCAFALAVTKGMAGAAHRVERAGVLSAAGPVLYALAALSPAYEDDVRTSYYFGWTSRPRPASRAVIDERVEAARLMMGEPLAIQELMRHGQYHRAAWAARQSQRPHQEAMAWYALGDFRRASDVLVLDAVRTDDDPGLKWALAVHALALRWDRAREVFTRAVQAQQFSSWHDVTGDDAFAPCVPLMLRARMDPHGALESARTVMEQRRAPSRWREPRVALDPAWRTCPRVVLDTMWRAGGSARELAVALSAGHEDAIEAAARSLLTQPLDAFTRRALAVERDAEPGGARSATVNALLRPFVEADALPPVAGTNDAQPLLELRSCTLSDESALLPSMPGLRAELRWGCAPRFASFLPSRRLGALYVRRANALTAGDPALAREIDAILRRYVRALMHRDVATVIWFIENR